MIFSVLQLNPMLEETQLVIEQLKATHPQAIILFGSAARGEVNKDSDIDILLIQKTQQSFSDRIRDVRLKLKTNLAIDLIVLTPQEAESVGKRNSFFSSILKEGKLLYGRV